MNRDKRNDSTPPQPASVFRGLYNRVARKLGVDPSYVSRVARGERRSEAVLSALTEEVRYALVQLEQRRQTRGIAAEKSKSAETAAALDQQVESLLATARRASKRATQSGKKNKRKGKRSPSDATTPPRH